MPRYVAFLRGINLGRRRVVMSRLVAVFKRMGFGRVETFIASGNVLFDADTADTGALETKISAALKSALGYEVDTFVRTTEAVAKIARTKIFPEDGEEGVIIHVAFLNQKLPAAVARKLAAVRTDVDAFRVKDREYYWRCRIRTSESEVWSLPEVRALRLPTVTMRNMTSIRKLVARHMERRMP
jgi:uncharacterized protein (DUF1697 family)